MNLINRTVLITGGASGIGFALARQLVAKGNVVIICGRNQEKLDKAKQQLPDLETIPCDINNPDDLNNLASFLSGKYPELDMLINNAGIQQDLNLTNDQISDHAIMLEISTNLTSQISITHRLYPLISSNTSPAIVFIGSALAFVPKYSAPIYSAAKAGIHSFAQSLRHQAGEDCVHVIEIFPDVIDTPMTHHRRNEKRMDADVFVSQALSKVAAGAQEVFTGRTKILNLLQRVTPTLALTVINKPNAG